MFLFYFLFLFKGKNKEDGAPLPEYGGWHKNIKIDR